MGSLGSGTHPANAPGNTAGETDTIYFDGTAGKGGNQNCTWNYTPTYNLAFVSFQNGWTQTVTFQDKDGFSVSATTSVVTGDSQPTLTPNGSSGTNAVAAITLKGGWGFHVTSGSTLFLQGYSSGDAIFLAGDGTAGEYLDNSGTVTYLGVGALTTDYLKIPVLNDGGVFNIKGNGSTGSGSALQVSGTDADTNNVSLDQTSSAQTNISGGGTLWCYNDYTMASGVLQTKDAYTDILMVGTSGSSPVDGTVTLTGGTVKINPGTNVYGTLQIVGTTSTNAPTLNVGTVQLMFKVNMTTGSNQCDQLIVGKPTGTGKVNFGYGSTTTGVFIMAQGTTTTGHHWPVIYFGTVTGTSNVAFAGPGTPNWKTNDLEIDN